MYTSFFGFRCKPFQLAPDPEFLFMSPVHKRALTYLNYGIKDNYGFILLTGEIGAGKTTIIRALLRLIPENIKVSKITNTKVSSVQLITMINEDFGLDTGDKDKVMMLSDLAGFLIDQYARGGRSILIIDEAQNLSLDLLEEVRLLSNLETDKSNLLQIILIGQPELNTTLARPELEQLRQRIAIDVYMRRLTREESEDYIRHRLKVAGNEYGVRFEKEGLETIYDFSNGIPRLINIICEFTLLAAYVEEKKIIDNEFIREIKGDLVKENTSPATAQGMPLDNAALEGLNTSLQSIHLRLQNLESALFKVQKKIARKRRVPEHGRRL